MRVLNSVLIGTLVILATTSAARADISGFNNLSGWQYNKLASDVGTPPDLPTPNTLHLTNLATGEARTVFYLSVQGMMQFAATFSYQALNASTFGCDYGTAFVIQNSPAGAMAVGSSGGGFGYAGIGNSAAITLGLQSNSSGFYTNGVIGGSGLTVSPISLTSGHLINVQLSYSGSILTENLFDTVTSQSSPPRNIIVGDLTAIVGPTGYVGFSASTTTGQCSGNAADQYISGFQFTVPEPASLGLLVFAAMGLGGRCRRSRFEGV